MIVVCDGKAFEEALKRETFGKQLIKHQLIRFKLSEMARQVEALYALLETIALQFKMGVKDFSLGNIVHAQLLCCRVHIHCTVSVPFPLPQDNNVPSSRYKRRRLLSTAAEKQVRYSAVLVSCGCVHVSEMFA